MGIVFLFSFALFFSFLYSEYKSKNVGCVCLGNVLFLKISEDTSSLLRH